MKGKKTGGRQKGTPNKRSGSTTTYLDDNDANPIKVLADAMKERLKEGNVDGAVYVASILAPYYSPRLAASKVEAEVTGLTYEEKLKILQGEDGAK